MKSLIRSLALILALVTVFSLPVSADDFTNDYLVNVLDYCTPNDSGYYVVNATSDTWINFPYQGMFYYIDMVVSHSGNSITGAQYTSSSGHLADLTVAAIGNGLFRVYGELPGVSSGSFSVKFTVPSLSAITFNSVRVSQVAANSFAEIGKFTYAGTTYAMSSTSTTGNAYVLNPDGQFNLFCSNWRKYDYLDFYFSVTEAVYGIKSINARFKGVSLPFYVSYLEGIDVEYDSDNVDIDNRNEYYVCVRVDITGLDKTDTTSYPVLTVEVPDCYRFALVYCYGTIVSNTVNPMYYYFRHLENFMEPWFTSIVAYQEDALEVQNTLYSAMTTGFRDVNSVLGLIRISVVDIFELLGEQYDGMQTYLTTKFKSVTDTLTSHYNGITSFLTTKFKSVTDLLDEIAHPDTSESDQFEDDMASQESELQEDIDVLDSVTKPAVDDIDVSIDAYVPDADLQDIGQTLGDFMSQQLVLDMIMISLTICLVGYVIFGKR